jgi:Cyclic nucleotide-binding domain
MSRSCPGWEYVLEPESTEGGGVRVEGSVTAISWIPSEAIEGMPKLPFELGVGHYDEPPPDRLVEGDLERLRDGDRFREANLLRAWIEVEDGKIVDCGYSGDGLVGSTTFKLGKKAIVVPGVAFEILREEPELSEDSARFVQTVGGRAGFPAPRRVSGKPYFQVRSATAWTTLALTLRADGTVGHELAGASLFPRHWIYGNDGELAHKSGTVDFKKWYRESHTDNTPWGEEDSPAVVAAAESALERELSRAVLSGSEELKRRKLDEGEVLVEQGDEGTDVYLLLDGIVAVEVDGEQVADMGPGTVLGERASLEEGKRTATLRAVTKSRVATLPAELLAQHQREALAAGRRREE